MNTIENNKLIAEFMGATIRMTDMNPENNTVFLSGETYFQDRLQFHTSWEWLMPVVEKIEEIALEEVEGSYKVHRFNVIIESFYCIVTDGRYEHRELIVADDGDKKSNVYYAVVEFIKWYNEQNRFICGSCGEHCNSYEYNEKTDVDECPDCQIKNK